MNEDFVTSHSRVGTRRPPSMLLCIAVPLLLLLLGTALAGMFAVKAYPELFEESARGVVPPGFQTDVLKPNRYTIWVYSYAQHDGVGYETGEGMPGGAELLVRTEPEGRSLDVTQFLNSTKSYQGESANAAGQFELPVASAVSVVGAGFSRETVVSIAPQKMESAFRVFLTAGGILVGTFLAAIISLFILLHRRKAIIETL